MITNDLTIAVLVFFFFFAKKRAMFLLVRNEKLKTGMHLDS
jgi:hypothetical protein